MSRRIPATRSRQNSDEELLASFKEICRKAGIKVTHQRLEIFRALVHSKDHPSVEDIFRRVKQKVPTIALDTVYRALTTLEQSGVLARVLLDTRIRFDPNTSVHHHFVCSECGWIEDFYWPGFDKLKLPAKKSPWGNIKSKRVEIIGICPACLKGKATSE